MSHTSDVTLSSSDATDARLLQSSVTSSELEVINGTVVLSDECAGSSHPGPVHIHVGDMKPPTLPNGFVNSGPKVIATNSSTSKGHRPVSLGMNLFV